MSKIQPSVLLTITILLLCGAGFSQSNLPYMNYAPVWSPDGKKIAFYSTVDNDWEVYSINTDGSQLTRLTHSPGYDGEPSWSPDGSMIAFASDRDGDSEIYVMESNGSNVVQVTDNSYDDDIPAWSPTSSKILYRSTRDGSPSLYMISSDGSGSRQLSPVVAQGRISWSRDGREFAFVIDYEGKQAISRTSHDGVQLGLVITKQDFPGNPSYSPNGGELLYDAHSDGIGDSGDGKWELWSVTVDGTTTRRLTNNNNDDWGAQWSPDGKQLVFAGGGRNNSGYDIFTGDVYGENLHQLTRLRD
jgi:Tol biopolymer transport system component